MHPRIIILLVFLTIYQYPNCQVLQTESLSPDEVKKLIKIGKEEKDFGKLAKAYYHRASNNMGPGIKSNDLIDDFQQSAIYYKFVKDSTNFHYARLGIVQVHINSESFLDEAIELTEASLKYSKENQELELEATCYTLLSQIYESRQDYDRALNNINAAVFINESLNNQDLKIKNTTTIGKLILNQGKVEQGIKLLQINLENIKNTELHQYNAENQLLLAEAYRSLFQNENAIKYYELAINSAPNGSYLKANSCLKLSELYEALGKYQLALDFKNKYFILNASINDLSNKEMLNRLVTNFNIKEQDQEITKLETEQIFKQTQIDQQKKLLYALGAATFAALIALFYIIRFYTGQIKVNQKMNEQRELLQKQEIKELENAVKINNLESVMYGQETERNRVAQDLHDSLGGKLSTIKLQFDALHDFDDSTAGDKKQVVHIHKLIDHACEEVRQVARNLKPSALENMGLEAAIKDLVNRYQNNGRYQISFISSTNNVDISYKKKLHLYRIVQEIINNAVKHANAKDIDIQLYAQDDKLSLTIEDDGKGFDTLTAKKGLGLNNIKSRLDLIEGDLVIDSQINNGSTFHITVPIMNQI